MPHFHHKSSFKRRILNAKLEATVFTILPRHFSTSSSHNEDAATRYVLILATPYVMDAIPFVGVHADDVVTTECKSLITSLLANKCEQAEIRLLELNIIF